MNWTQIIIVLGPPLISGFFAWLSGRGAKAARAHASSAKTNADVAVIAASLRPPKGDDDGY